VGPPNVFGSGIFPDWRCWHDTGFQILNRRWSALSPAQIARSSVPVTLTTWSPPGSPGGSFLPATVAAFASSPAALAVLAVRSTPRSRVRWPGSRWLTAGSARRWCPSGAGRAGALRGSGAGLRHGVACGPAGALVRHVTEPGAVRRAGIWPGVSRSVTQSGFDAVDARSWLPSMAGWRRAAARLAPCRSLIASPVSTGGKRNRPVDRPGTHAYRRFSSSQGGADLQ
jgi:hypothetical protein